MKIFYILSFLLFISFKLSSQCSFGDNQGNTGNMLTLDGAIQYAQSGVGTNDILNNSSFTIECWVKFATASPGKSHFICEIGQEGGAVGPWLWFNNNNDFGLENGIHVGFGGGLDQGYPFNPCANMWYHLAYVFNYTTLTITVYVNGTSLGDIKENNFDPKTNYIAQPVIHFGRRTYPLNDSYLNLNGNIDEFRLWKVARTATQIKDNYMKEISGKQSGLVAYYKFDDPSNQNTIKDCGPSNLNGSIVNQGNLNRSLSPAKNIKSACMMSTNFMYNNSSVKSLQPLIIYPNPASDEINFEFQNSFSNGIIKIYDLQGRLIISEKLNAESLTQRINFKNNTAKGVYMVHILLDDESFIEKLIVE